MGEGGRKWYVKDMLTMGRVGGGWSGMNGGNERKGRERRMVGERAGR